MMGGSEKSQLIAACARNIDSLKYFKESMAQNDTFVFIDVRSIPSSDVIFNQNLSVCPSVKRMDCDKTKESCAHTLISHERPFILAL